jgi:hypothetical protein
MLLEHTERSLIYCQRLKSREQKRQKPNRRKKKELKWMNNSREQTEQIHLSLYINAILNMLCYTLPRIQISQRLCMELGGAQNVSSIFHTRCRTKRIKIPCLVFLTEYFYYIFFMFVNTFGLCNSQSLSSHFSPGYFERNTI